MATQAAPLVSAPRWASVAKPGPYTTQLDPNDETQFQSWVKQNKIPWQDSPAADYDMRGFWKAQQGGNPNAQRAANLHFPDTWKTPYHETFSNESQYATPKAGHWEGDKFVPPNTTPHPLAGLGFEPDAADTTHPLASLGFEPEASSYGTNVPPSAAENLRRSKDKTQFEIQNEQPWYKRLPLEFAGGVGASAGVPETKTPIADMGKGVLQQAEDLSAYGKSPTEIVTGPVKAAYKMGKAVFSNAAQGASDIYAGAGGGLTPEEKRNRTDIIDTSRMAHGLGELTGSGAAVASMAKPGLSAARTALAEDVAPRLGNVALGASKRILKSEANFGREPGLAIAQEPGVAATTVASRPAFFSERIKDVGKTIGDRLNSPQLKGIQRDATKLIDDPIDEGIADAVKRNDQASVDALEKLRSTLKENRALGANSQIASTGPRSMQMNAAELNEMKTALGDSAKWTGTAFERGQPLNDVRVSIYRNLRKTIEGIDPGIKSLNERYGNLLTAHDLSKAEAAKLRTTMPGLPTVKSVATAGLGSKPVQVAASRMLGRNYPEPGPLPEPPVAGAPSTPVAPAGPSAPPAATPPGGGMPRPPDFQRVHEPVAGGGMTGEQPGQPTTHIAPEELADIRAETGNPNLTEEGAVAHQLNKRNAAGAETRDPGDLKAMREANASEMSKKVAKPIHEQLQVAGFTNIKPAYEGKYIQFDPPGYPPGVATMTLPAEGLTLEKVQQYFASKKALFDQKAAQGLGTPLPSPPQL